MHPQIALEPTDWYWAAWRALPPLQRPSAAPFDLDACLQRIDRFAKRVKDPASKKWDWSQAGIAPALSPEEALFWFEAIPIYTGLGASTETAGERVRALRFDRLALQKIRQKAADLRTIGHPEMLITLVNLFEPPQPVAALRYHLRSDDTGQNHQSMTEGFRRYVLPYLSAEERRELTEPVRVRVLSGTWPDNHYRAPRAAFFFAALLGLHDLVERTLAQIGPAFYQQGHRSHQAALLEAHRPLDLVFGLADRDAVRTRARGLGLWATRPDQVRAWLAATELDDLDWAVESVLRAESPEQAARLLGALACVRAPELAPEMRRLALRSSAPRIARDWLRDRAPAPDAPPAPDTTPDWLRAALAQVQRPKRKPSEWLDASMLPQLHVAGHTLSPAQAETLLDALRQSTLEQPHPLLPLVRAHADPAALDALLWRLLACWEDSGAPARERWAFAALGLLGSDALARGLGQRVHAWRKRGFHKRAAFGLKCLSALGSDAALQTLNQIAQEPPLRAIRQWAVAEIEAVAAQRGLTRSQLEDRIVPTFGLDGSEWLDYGPRRFALALGDDLAPLLRDARGRLLNRLPRAAAGDDPELVAQARERWKALKRLLAEEIVLQTKRLERCLIFGRRWAPDEFARVVLGHPLMAPLARRLIWAGCGPDGRMRAAFCLADATSPTAEDYAPLRLEDFAAVALAHPLHATPAQRQRWIDLLLDFGVAPLLPQGARPVVTLSPAELEGDLVTRYSAVRLKEYAIGALARPRGWRFASAYSQSGQSDDFYAVRQLEDARLSAAMFNRQVKTDSGATYEQIERCYFVEGLLEPNELLKPHRPIPLRELDPVLVSEVLCDLEAITGSEEYRYH
jgi:hypothetical protein